MGLPAWRPRQAGSIPTFGTNMFWVYAIASTSRNYIYVGLTSDLEKRFSRHNRGQERTTKPYIPFIIIYSEEFPDRPSAREREKYLKTSTGKRKLRAIRDELIGKAGS